ncbi:hypothetical protein FHT78_000269 [Rhizobium sp. BK196]|jgi:hypothetical protein|uniref:hypothetical protein n=1 Tax=Rhizobium sp. BK196 TaxID=2587073 RepID=UPI00161FC0CF|nr:hypothetical protein [Rhizobium sp. BK196]MBB3308540.1 hypothetical protein [Rhizobium sp. BK196]
MKFVDKTPTFEDRVGVICEECEILKFFQPGELEARYPAADGMDSVNVMALQLFGCERVKNQWYDRCRMHFYFGPREWARRMGYVHPDELKAAAARRTIGELAEWEQMKATCLKCKHSRWLDRWALQKRYGKGLALSELGARLKCRCGRRGAEIEIGYMSR